MIHYNLLCAAGHEFDGWYKDSGAFDRLAAAKLVDCPHCGTQDVSRALMAPAIGKRAAPPRQEADAPAAPTSPSGPTAVATPHLPDEVLAALQKLRAEVEKHCDYVGSDLADEARRIRRGETAARGIYGETTQDEAEALADEGIALTAIPWVRRADS